MSSHHGILIHVIFSTKYRKPLLHETWRGELLAYIGGTIREHKALLLQAGGVEDHIHLLMRIHPQFAIASTIQLLKANSSKWINETHKLPGKFHWQIGYAAFSVSQSMSETVKLYIANQVEHHRKLTFREEYVLLLKKHGIEFDPKYLFDGKFMG